MDNILEMLDKLTAVELDQILAQGKTILEKKRKQEEALALLKKERERQEKIEQEKKRQEEIARLQEKLRQLQSQPAYVPDEVSGGNFVMRETAAEKPASASQTARPSSPVVSTPQQTSPKITCPFCRQANPSGSAFCSNCGKSITVSASSQTQFQSSAARINCAFCGHANPSGSAFCLNCGKKLQAAQQQNASDTASSSSVRYHDGTMKKWELLPGEKIIVARHDVKFIEPDMGKKHFYMMEITSKRILFTRVGVLAANAGVAFGLIGTLARDATNSGPKPWLEIPLEAVKGYGVCGKKDFYFVADQKYVLKNKHYEETFDDLID